MPVINRTAPAQRDLDGIYDYIAEDNPAAAERFIRRIHKRLQSLARAPLIGQRCTDLPDDLPELRLVIVGNYVLFYRALPDGIELYRVIHGARDIPAILRGQTPGQ